MSRTVMFVDDDDVYLMVVQRVCKKISSIESVVTALNGALAVAELTRRVESGAELPGTVFVDINMPVMDGFEFLEAFAALRDKHPELRCVRPIAMLTSSDEQRDRVRAASLGADTYIVKGDLDETRETLTEALA